MFLDVPEYTVLTGILLVILTTAAIRTFFKRSIKITNSLHNQRSHHNILTATYKPYRALPVGLVLVAVVGWVLWESWTIYSGQHVHFKLFYIGSGLLLVIQLVLSLFHRAYKSEQQLDVHTVVIVPVYNECRHALRDCLGSLLRQTHMPDEVHVVDDATTQEDYAEVKRWFKAAAARQNVRVSWHRHKQNKGKRHAHVTALSNVDRSDKTIIITIDSDGTLDPQAIQEGIKPFGDPKIQSVAGLVIAKNAQDSILARFTDLLFVGVQQLIDRASMSVLGSVLVNSGGLAFYRASVVDDAIKHGYTSETFFGRAVRFSDDSFLTLFALLQGKAVQQPSAIVFADMPVTFDHHVRQQMRWLRGSFIRSWWRLRYLPIISWSFIRQLIGWGVLLSSTLILLELLIILPLMDGDDLPWLLLLVPLVIGYIQTVRYFAIVRSDMTLRSQLFGYLLAPVAAFWSAIVLRSMRWYAMATCFRTAWGTRQVVEIPSISALED